MSEVLTIYLKFAFLAIFLFYFIKWYIWVFEPKDSALDYWHLAGVIWVTAHAHTLTHIQSQRATALMPSGNQNGKSFSKPNSVNQVCVCVCVCVNLCVCKVSNGVAIRDTREWIQSKLDCRFLHNSHILISNQKVYCDIQIYTPFYFDIN